MNKATINDEISKHLKKQDDEFEKIRNSLKTEEDILNYIKTNHEILKNKIITEHGYTPQKEELDLNSKLCKLASLASGGLSKDNDVCELACSITIFFEKYGLMNKEILEAYVDDGIDMYKYFNFEK